MEKQDTRVELTEERVREIVREEILEAHYEESILRSETILGEKEAHRVLGASYRSRAQRVVFVNPTTTSHMPAQGQFKWTPSSGQR